MPLCGGGSQRERCDCSRIVQGSTLLALKEKEILVTKHGELLEHGQGRDCPLGPPKGTWPVDTLNPESQSHGSEF
jgi:hypothetical protein